MVKFLPYNLLVLALSLSMFLSLIPTRADAAIVPLKTCAEKTVISHRGMWDATHTENTMASFKNAIDNGMTAVEGDMQVTRDGQWILMHDYRINRTTNKRGYVKKRSLAYIKSARTNDGVVGGVPTLHEALTYFQSQPNVKIFLEIKSRTVSDTRLRDLLTILNQYGLKDRLVVESERPTMMDRVYAIDPTFTLAYIARSAVAPDVVMAHHSNILIIRYNYVSPELVDAMHLNGIKVYSWTVDEQPQWASSITADVDGVLSNQVVLLGSLCIEAVNAANIGGTPDPNQY